MPQLLVRDVPRDIVEALKIRAAEHGRSVEAEHRLLLEETLRPARNTFRQRAAALRAATKDRIEGESAEIIRAERARR